MKWSDDSDTVLMTIRELYQAADHCEADIDHIFELLLQLNREVISDVVFHLEEAGVWKYVVTLVSEDKATTSSLGIMYIFSAVIPMSSYITEVLCTKLVELARSPDYDTALFSIGIVANIVTASPQMVAWLVQSGNVFETVRTIMKSEPDQDHVSVTFELMYCVLQATKCLTKEQCFEWAEYFMHRVDEVSLLGLDLCISAASGNEMELIDMIVFHSFFEGVPRAIEEPKTASSALHLMSRMLCRGSASSLRMLRSRLSLEVVRNCSFSDDLTLVSTFLISTRDILCCHWKFAVDFMNVGILDRILELSRDGEYRIRKLALRVLMKLLTRFSTDMVHHFVKKGMISVFVDFIDESDPKFTVLTLESLTYILQNGLAASLIADVFDAVLSCGLREIVQSLSQLPNPTVREAAEAFYNEFLNTEQFLEL